MKVHLLMRCYTAGYDIVREVVAVYTSKKAATDEAERLNAGKRSAYRYEVKSKTVNDDLKPPREKTKRVQTPEQKAAAEVRRKLRLASMTDEQYAEHTRKAYERKKRSIANETPERRAKRLSKQNEAAKRRYWASRKKAD